MPSDKNNKIPLMKIITLIILNGIMKESLTDVGS